ncbi:hypothetical protein TheveDRAFT_0431 [Thermanaerovibrio velox DSM 12556]|uniref:Magnesium transporter MgtE intracellular domain-containing protein n=1 Tax=Thermanaerovibrio velox DSM 12556 TaxID=926567 RepID=H0UPP8_9BACT|nr:hypothetical protein [Thermanaerovibrio velox]EHM09595.1 hypothetical protein TheveDRAFT_0431 [Thermanaerovibrio velox DSM 12556]
MILFVGAALGLHFSGALDLRGVLFSAIYRIPKVGAPLGAALGIPSTYAMSAQDRRMMEIRLMEENLAKMKAELDREKTAVEVVSDDLNRRSLQVAKLQEELQARLKELALSDDTKPQARLESLEEVLKTYRDMSPRNAAQIIGKMDEDLAVEILSRLPNDQAAKILGRMDADRAARLTERLAMMKKKP